MAIAALVLLGGLLSATLVRLAPGFDADERELDPSLNAESVRALRQSRAGEHNILGFYAGYLRGAIARRSRHFSRPRPTRAKPFARALARHRARGRRWPFAGMAAGLDSRLHRLPLASYRLMRFWASL